MNEYHGFIINKIIIKNKIELINKYHEFMSSINIMYLYHEFISFIDIMNYLL